MRLHRKSSIGLHRTNLWLFPLGLLVYRSGFLPRILGVLLMVACFGWLANGLPSVLFPQYEDIVSKWMMPVTFGEVVFMFWLLIKGAIPKALAGPASSAAVG